MSAAPLLETQGLTRRFMGVRALEDVDLVLMENETLGLIGPNGAGKTTLFNLLSGLTPPTAGTVLYQGAKISGLPPHRIAALGISRTFQNIRLFPGLSVLEHILIGAHTRARQGLWGSILRTRAQRREEDALREQAWRILAMLDLTDVAEEAANALPYGRQRRVEIARALASSPSVLLLDEPAAGMNPTERAELQQLIKTIAGHVRGIILIEHDIEFVSNLCHRIAVLNFGRKITEGTPDAIRRHPDVIEAYLGQEV